MVEIEDEGMSTCISCIEEGLESGEMIWVFEITRGGEHERVGSALLIEVSWPTKEGP